MKLERLHIKRFKSLYDVGLDFAQFRVITGPNGAGKSNLVDSIAFLGEVYRFGVEYAVGRAGGIDSISFRDKRRTTVGVNFSVEASIPLQEIRLAPRRRPREFPNCEISVRHRFTLKSSSQQTETDYYLADEYIEITASLEGETSFNLLKYSSSGDEIELLWPDKDELSGISKEITEAVVPYFMRLEPGQDPFTENMVGAPGASAVQELATLTPILREFRSRMSFIQAYRLNPAACRTPGVLTPNAALEMDGSNLPAAVARASHSSTATWGRVLSGMRQLMPDLDHIDTAPSPEHGLVLRFHESGRGRPWTAREVSDGFIQSLALLMVLYDRRPPLLLIEEPENAVHPWVLRRFLEHCRSASDRQIVITTHSPVLLSSARPDEVVLMWRTKGRSELKPFNKALRESEKLYAEKGFDVFELYDSGLITETIPGRVDMEKD